jgi:hypothetical protein
MKPGEFSPPDIGTLPQADAYPGFARRGELLSRVEQLLRRYYPPQDDPYRIYEREIAARLRPGHTLLDAGCGRTAPVLNLFAPAVERAIGVDRVAFEDAAGHGNVELINHDLVGIPLARASVASSSTWPIRPRCTLSSSGS